MINFKELNNKKIIVTGSSTGICFETAIEFLNLNAKVIFHGNNSIKNLEKKIKTKSKSNKFHIIQSDFSDINNVQKFIRYGCFHNSWAKGNVPFNITHSFILSIL